MGVFFKTKKGRKMKSVFLSVAMVLGLVSVSNADHVPVRPVRCGCGPCHCSPFMVRRHHVGRGVLNYSVGVGGRMWNGFSLFITAPFREPFHVPQSHYIVTPGHYHPGTVQRVVPYHHRHNEPQVELGRPEPIRR